MATNISIAIPFFAGASDAAILFKDERSGELFVVAAKGCFQALCSHDDGLDDDSWKVLTRFADEQEFRKRCESLNISVVQSHNRQVVKGISLGSAYTSATGCTINVSALIDQPQIDPEELRQLLEEEAFNKLAIVCKTRGCLAKLRSFLTRHKRQEVAVRLEDLDGAGEIMKEMAERDHVLTLVQKDQLQAQLRAAHATNRSAYMKRLESPSEEAQTAKDLNRLIDSGLALLASIENAGYTADILGRKVCGPGAFISSSQSQLARLFAWLG